MNFSFYFLKNEFGDIIYICDAVSGAVFAKYSYDAWGRCSIEQDLNGIAEVNPFRYRGYYMDSETGWYYLQTRYYDPLLRRFISADNYELTTQLSAGELNMFAYCANNPIMYTDESGQAVLLGILISAFLIGGTIGGTIKGIGAAINGASFWQIAGSFGSGFILSGALSVATALGGLAGVGAIAGWGIAAAVGTAGVLSFGAGLSSYALEQAAYGQNINVSTMFKHGGLAAFQGLIGFGVGAAFGSAGLWDSLKDGNRFFQVLQKSGAKSVGGILKASAGFFQNNMSAMIVRGYLKAGLATTSWGMLKYLF